MSSSGTHTTHTGTDGRNMTSAAPAGTPAPSDTSRHPLLRGLLWVVWHRHRNALRAGILVTVLACAFFAYQRFEVMDFLQAKGGDPTPDDDLLMEFQEKFSSQFSKDTQFLQIVPAIVGIFFGAPLIAGEQERGTIKLLTTQSTGRGKWIAASIGLPLTVAVLCTAALTAAFTWLWWPARKVALFGDWLQGGAFESTGPVLISMTLFMTSCGIAIGMLVKRVVPAMVLTALFATVTSVAWDERLRAQLGTLRSMVWPYNGESPDLPAGAVQMDDWVATADGKLYGFSTCAGDNTEACRAELGIVNRVTQYFAPDQMAGMQWLGAGILLALTAAVLTLVVWRARRRPL